MPHGWSHHHMSLRLAEGVMVLTILFYSAYLVAHWTVEHQSGGSV